MMKNNKLPPAPAHLPQSMMHSIKALPTGKRLILFTRHSLRERSDGKGFASSDLSLTPRGKVLAQAWGRWLAQNTHYSLDTPSIASPIFRCANTAKLMLEGANIEQIVSTHFLLVEPGSLVTDAQAANRIFKTKGALSFINSFLNDQLGCTKTAHQGVKDLLKLLYEHQPAANHLALAVSHDTLLSAFLGVALHRSRLDWDDWPKMMEGAFVWFDDAADFEQSTAHLIWRGQHHTLPCCALESS